MSDHESRPQPDTVDDEWLAKLYNEDSGATPPASLDAAILAEAQAKKFSPATARPAIIRPPWQRWTGPALASAAAVLLTVGLFVSQPAFRQGAQLSESAAPQAEMQLQGVGNAVHSEPLRGKKDTDIADFDDALAKSATVRDDQAVTLRLSTDISPSPPAGEAEMSVGPLSRQQSSGSRLGLAQLKARREQSATLPASIAAAESTEPAYILNSLACDTAPCASEVSHPQCPHTFALSAQATDIVIEAGKVVFTLDNQRQVLTCEQQTWLVNITAHSPGDG